MWEDAWEEHSEIQEYSSKSKNENRCQASQTNLCQQENVLTGKPINTGYNYRFHLGTDTKFHVLKYFSKIVYSSINYP